MVDGNHMYSLLVCEEKGKSKLHKTNFNSDTAVHNQYAHYGTRWRGADHDAQCGYCVCC